MSSQVLTYYTYPTAIGPLTLQCTENAIVRIAFGTMQLQGENRPTTLSNMAANELHEYFSGRRHTFSIPLDAQGTEFQHAVWDCLLRIPYGQTRSYADVAASIGHPRSYRAVGMACNANPLPIIVPCHRVVGSGGVLGGYAGGIERKQTLLDLEMKNA